MAERSLDDLIDTHDPAPPLVWQWISGTSHPVEILLLALDSASDRWNVR